MALFEPMVDARPLTFEFRGEGIVDIETGSNWSLLGQATGGSLAGKRLLPVLHGNHFWFAWAVFMPGTRVRNPGSSRLRPGPPGNAAQDGLVRTRRFAASGR